MASRRADLPIMTTSWAPVLENVKLTLSVVRSPHGPARALASSGAQVLTGRSTPRCRGGAYCGAAAGAPPPVMGVGERAAAGCRRSRPHSGGGVAAVGAERAAAAYGRRIAARDRCAPPHRRAGGRPAGRRPACGAPRVSRSRMWGPQCAGRHGARFGSAEHGRAARPTLRNASACGDQNGEAGGGGVAARCVARPKCSGNGGASAKISPE